MTCTRNVGCFVLCATSYAEKLSVAGTAGLARGQAEMCRRAQRVKEKAIVDFACTWTLPTSGVTHGSGNTVTKQSQFCRDINADMKARFRGSYLDAERVVVPAASHASTIWDDLPLASAPQCKHPHECMRTVVLCCYAGQRIHKCIVLCMCAHRALCCREAGMNLLAVMLTSVLTLDVKAEVCMAVCTCKGARTCNYKPECRRGRCVDGM